ncbi:hypothetical protein E3E35_03435 [Thermococcus sp. GR7]|uniref:hypothetical protein n=1 Tax=unclassified Thermococcus TaxID=2627626 RepID=UPI001431E857|nr:MULTISPECIES: hypothetical protein [unclassified Thermococcus]NJE46482.1 hypothetical protein [Thermococcus sp. GR7]NJE77599.1 hypothetical protein [Thermococcus sp. GR4]NJF23688.1 hypothetical protein [Thermococcus sp. GR5]
MLVLGVILLLGVWMSLILATENTVLSDYYGEHISGPSLFLDGNVTNAPEDPGIVYIIVMADEPLKTELEKALSEKVKAYNLTPVLWRNDPVEVNLKGRVIIAYALVTGKPGAFFIREPTLTLCSITPTLEILRAFRGLSKG